MQLGQINPNIIMEMIKPLSSPRISIRITNNDMSITELSSKSPMVISYVKFESEEISNKILLSGIYNKQEFTDLEKLRKSEKGEIIINEEGFHLVNTPKLVSIRELKLIYPMGFDNNINNLKYFPEYEDIHTLNRKMNYFCNIICDNNYDLSNMNPTKLIQIEKHKSHNSNSVYDITDNETINKVVGSTVGDGIETFHFNQYGKTYSMILYKNMLRINKGDSTNMSLYDAYGNEFVSVFTVIKKKYSVVYFIPWTNLS